MKKSLLDITLPKCPCGKPECTTKRMERAIAAIKHNLGAEVNVVSVDEALINPSVVLPKRFRVPVSAVIFRNEGSSTITLLVDTLPPETYVPTSVLDEILDLADSKGFSPKHKMLVFNGMGTVVEGILRLQSYFKNEDIPVALIRSTRQVRGLLARMDNNVPKHLSDFVESDAFNRLYQDPV